MTLFYLSFADKRPPKGKGWLGGAYVEADDFGDAVTVAAILGINPGGQVLGAPCHTEVEDRWLNRLLTKDEVRESEPTHRLVNQRGKEV